MGRAKFSMLAFMMLLQYFIWGSWYVTLGTYMSEFLRSNGIQIGAAYGALAIATMISPFFVGMVADRFFAAQRIMGVLHITGGLFLYLATTVGDNREFYWIIVLYSLIYMPTVALSNSIVFQQAADPNREFPRIRMFGTLGWIIAGLMIGYLGIEKTASTFYLAAASSIILGCVSFMLPDTPPKASAPSASLSQSIGLEAISLLQRKSYLVFFITSILICIPLSFYYGFANLFLNKVGFQDAAGWMVLGQVSEAVFILAIPFLLIRIGIKNILMLGMAAWILRYVLFAFGDSGAGIWMLYAGIILHGICYDFFFVSGYMYTEREAGDRFKSSAQGLFTFATYGVGMFIGTNMSGFVVNNYSTPDIYQWQSIWMVPAAISLGVLVVFAFLFREKNREPGKSSGSNRDYKRRRVA